MNRKTMTQSMDKKTTEASKDADDPDEPNSGMDILIKIDGKASLEADHSRAYFTTLYSPPTLWGCISCWETWTKYIYFTQIQNGQKLSLHKKGCKMAYKLPFLLFCKFPKNH